VFLQIAKLTDTSGYELIKNGNIVNGEWTNFMQRACAVAQTLLRQALPQTDIALS
jgi:hypothetical protein